MDKIVFSDIPASKSLMIRALCVKSYKNTLQIDKTSNADDVLNFNQAIQNLYAKKFYVGKGATPFRFLSLRLSKIPGEHIISVDPQLKNRPNFELSNLLNQLGVSSQWQGNDFIIYGKDWDLNKSIKVDISESSQFASALLLNAWELKNDLTVELNGNMVSKPYWEMSLGIAKQAGLKVVSDKHHFVIKKEQKVSADQLNIEIDLSCAFVNACLMALTTGGTIKNIPLKSKQADKQFVSILKKMGVNLILDKTTLHILPTKKLFAIHANLRDCPDLFPVLATMATFAQGESKLFGAKHLKTKESDRIQASSDLFRIMQIPHEKLDDGMIIFGSPNLTTATLKKYDPQGDHRMLFAASIAKIKGININILNPDCCNKSFPQFCEQFSKDFFKMDLLQ